MKIPLRGIRYFSQQETSLIKSLMEFTHFLYKRNGWMLDFSRYWSDFEEVEIDSPIFLLGTESGGLTLVSRMIRRNKDFVSVSGNYRYWSGADEMQLVLGAILPPEFTGVRRHRPSILKEVGVTGSWLYATDELLPYHRKTEKDVTLEVKKKMRKIIRWMINRHAINKGKARFIDKSQSFTVKVSFLNEILKDTDPKFVLITRNPYALCYKAAEGKCSRYLKKKNDYSPEKALELACQHWKNSMECALEDEVDVESFFRIKFEDILQEPQEKMREVCDFVEIDFDKDLLPQPEHKIPFGCKGKNKWYPLRLDVNEKYFNKMTQENVEIIHSVVQKQAEKLSYSKPQL